MSDETTEALFRRWIAEFGGVLLKVARAYTLAAEDREDLLQEILLQLWRSVPRFQDRCSACTWIYRVALNTALGWHRKEGRRRARQEPLLEPETLPLEGPDAAAQLGQCELVERLYEAIRQLPKPDAAVVLLYLEDLSYREMAEVLGISQSHLGVKLNRAKKALAEQMKEVVYES